MGKAFLSRWEVKCSSHLLITFKVDIIYPRFINDNVAKLNTIVFQSYAYSIVYNSITI